MSSFHVLKSGMEYELVSKTSSYPGIPFKKTIRTRLIEILETENAEKEIH